MVTVEPVGLVTQLLITLGSHVKLGFLCNQRCHVQLILAFFFVNALGDWIVVGGLFATMVFSTTFLETILGGFPKIDLEAVVDLEEMPYVHF